MDKKLILNELRNRLGFKTDLEFSNFLGVKQNTFSSWKQRNSIDYDLIIKKCDNINGHWLLTGEGPIMLFDKPNDVGYKEKYYNALEESNQLMRDLLSCRKKIDQLTAETSALKTPLKDRQVS